MKLKLLKKLLLSPFLLIFLQEVFDYLKHLSIAYLLSFSFQTGAIFMAVSLLGIFLIFVDIFDSIGVPNLVKARLESEEEFYRLSGLLFTFTLFGFFNNVFGNNFLSFN